MTMKLKNTTDYPDHFLRRMVAWCCKQLECPPSIIREAAFRNRSDRYTSGHAYWAGRGRFVVSSGKLAADRVKDLVGVTAHEIFHLLADSRGIRTRRHGKSSGSSERQTNWHQHKVEALFVDKRETILGAWYAEPAARPAQPKPSVQDQRAAKAQAALDRWQRKLKLAQTKVRKLKQRAAYYEKVIAAKRMG
jgi:hypothetical protein